MHACTNLTGAAGGTIATLVTHPFDAIKVCMHFFDAIPSRWFLRSYPLSLRAPSYVDDSSF